MAEIAYEIFFPTAYSARLAFSQIRTAGAVLEGIEHVNPPLNGRAWKMTLVAPSMSQAARFISPEVRQIIINAANRYDGMFAGSEYAETTEGNPE